MSQENKKCLGCGITLQAEVVTKIGYTTSLENIYCQACFQLKNYAIATTHTHPLTLPDFKAGSVVVLVVSVLFLDTIFDTKLNRLSQQKLIILVNQIDLLPSSTNLDKLVENIKKRLTQNKINFFEIILMSAKNKYDLINLKGYLNEYVSNDIYLIGIQNSGKTTIFKYLTNNTEALNNKKAALTQEILWAKMDRKNIYDTPGLYQNGYLHDFLDYKAYRKILPEKEIKPVVFNLKEESSLIVDGLVSLTALKLSNASVVCYFSSLLKIHRTNQTKVDNLLKEHQRHFKYGFDSYQTINYKLKENVKYQITVADFGFFHLQGPAVVEIKLPNKMHISLMESLFR